MVRTFGYWGAFPRVGISFVDTNNVRRHFYIFESMEDGSLNIIEFENKIKTNESSSGVEIEEAMVNKIMEYFEETHNRVFEISYPVNIEGENYYKITVYGLLNSGEKYLLDTFAVGQNIYLSEIGGAYRANRYFYNSDTGQFQQYWLSPIFASATSPDKKWRIESFGMTDGGASGFVALQEMRIINLSTGNVEWSGTGFLKNRFIWSDDSRFVAAQNSGRQWTSLYVIDTTDFSYVYSPGAADIFELVPDLAAATWGMSDVIAVGWENSSVIIRFHWAATDHDTYSIVVTAKYEYDMINGSINILEFEIDETDWE
jgi:hypothetical protein